MLTKDELKEIEALINHLVECAGYEYGSDVRDVRNDLLTHIQKLEKDAAVGRKLREMPEDFVLKRGHQGSWETRTGWEYFEEYDTLEEALGIEEEKPWNAEFVSFPGNAL